MKLSILLISIFVMVLCFANFVFAEISYLAGYTPEFEEAPCPFEVSQDALESIDCGYITVPENWDAADSRQIRIPVAVLRALSGDPFPDPLIRIEGGPMPTLVNAPFFVDSRLRQDRDLVLFDLRGTGFGDVVCPDVGPAYFRVLAGSLSAEQTQDELRRIGGQCRRWADEQGVDLGMYNSRQMAFDVIAIARSLDYNSWNLLGLSYGTRVALAAMRLQPDGLHTAILGGSVPPDIETIELNPFSRALGLMEEYCAEDPACAATFPSVITEYNALFERFESDPVPMQVSKSEVFPDGTIHLKGITLQRFVYQFLYDRLTLAATPLLLREIARGNTQPLSTLIEQFVPLADQLTGVNWAAHCYDLGGWAQSYEIPAPYGPDDDNFRMEVKVRCAGMGLGPAPPAERLPVESDLPVLILAGEHDPVTPPAYGLAVSNALQNSHYVEFPGRGHEFPPECTLSMIGAFLAEPLARPDDSCVEDTRTVPFVTDVRITPGMGRLAMSFMHGGSRGELVILAVPLLFLLSVLAWPAGALYRRVRRREQPLRTTFELRARWAAGVVSLIAVAFVVALVWVIMNMIADNPIQMMFGVPSTAAPLFFVPWVLLAGGIVLLMLTGIAWKRKTWSTAKRVHYTLIAVSAVSFSAILINWGLI